MKKFLAIAFVAMMSLGTMAQTAQQVLNKTAAIVGNKKGASASFKLSSPKYGSTSGSIAIKGNKFIMGTSLYNLAFINYANLIGIFYSR